MAQSLQDGIASSNSGNPLPGLSQAEFLEYLDQYNDADNVVKQAVAARNRLRKDIAAKGVPLAALDRVRKDVQKSGAIREQEDAAYRRMMAWQLKPVGFQASMDIANDPTVDPGHRALAVHELKQIDNEGFDAGKAGHRADRNQYTPGTEAHARWHTAWLRGQAEKVGELGGDAPAPAENGGRRRGRRGRPRKAPAEDAGATQH